MPSVSERQELCIGWLLHEKTDLCHFCIFWLCGYTWSRAILAKKCLFHEVVILLTLLHSHAVIWVDLQRKTEIEIYFWKPENHTWNCGHRLAAEQSLRFVSCWILLAQLLPLSPVEWTVLYGNNTFVYSNSTDLDFRSARFIRWWHQLYWHPVTLM